MKYAPVYPLVAALLLLCLPACVTPAASTPQADVEIKVTIVHVTEIISVTACGDVYAYIFVFNDGRTMGYDVRDAVDIKPMPAASDGIRFHHIEVAEPCPRKHKA